MGTMAVYILSSTVGLRLLVSHNLLFGERLVILYHGAEKWCYIVHHSNIDIGEGSVAFFPENEISFRVFPSFQWYEEEGVIGVGAEDFSGIRDLAERLSSGEFPSHFLIDGPNGREARVILIYEKSWNCWMLFDGKDVVDPNGL